MGTAGCSSMDLDGLVRALAPSGGAKAGPMGVRDGPVALLPGPLTLADLDAPPAGAHEARSTAGRPRLSMTGRARRAIRRNDLEWMRQALAEVPLQVDLGHGPQDTLPPEDGDQDLWRIRQMTSRHQPGALINTAVECGSPAMVQLLLDAGATTVVTSWDEREDIPLCLPTIGSAAVLDLLLRHRWTPGNLNVQTRLWRAVAHHQHDLVDAWCAMGGDLRARDEVGRSALHHAVLPGGGLWERGSEIYRQKHVYGAWVAERCSRDPAAGVAMVERLLAMGLDLEDRCQAGFTVLQTAVHHHPDQWFPDDLRDRFAARHHVVQAALVRHLIARGADLNADGRMGSPLMMATHRPGWEHGLVRALWEAGARWTVPEGHLARSPGVLGRAVLTGSTDLITLGLALGEDPAGPAANSWFGGSLWVCGMEPPPLVRAVLHGFDEGVALLLAAGADPAQALEHPYWAWAQANEPHPALVESLVQRRLTLEQRVLRATLASSHLADHDRDGTVLVRRRL